MNVRPFSERHLLHALCAIYLVAWIVAAIDPVKRDDWLLENVIVIAFVGLLVATYRRLPLGDLSCVLLFIFLLLHAAGAHYTYAEVPLGYWAKETFGLSRNHFDRLVHFSFGLLLLQPAREVLMRVAGGSGFWSWCLPMTLVVSLSGLFEIVEAVAAWNVNPELGTAYLGTQGDVWDAQKDMALAVAGAALAVLLAQAASRWPRPVSRVPREIRTTATLTMIDQEDAFRITKIHLATEGSISVGDEAAFQAAAEKAKANCPVSKLLGPGLETITLDAKLVA